MTSPAIDDLMRILMQPITTENEAAGEAAAIALGRQNTPDAAAAIDTLAASDEADQRFWAVRSLWANGGPPARQQLIALLADTDDTVRSVAALALGELRAETAIDALARLMTTEESAMGEHAADALAKIGQAATARLIEALHHPKAWARVRAAKALVPIESKTAIKDLIDRLDNDESYLVRHYADAALKKMGVGQMIYFK